jgi:hypothetical protein
VSLFHHGKELFDRFGFTMESEITFSDGCSDLIYPHQTSIRFTSKSLIFSNPKEGFHDSVDDWIELDSLEFHPWHNIFSFQNVKGTEIVEQYDEQTIADWLLGVNDPAIDFPYIDVRKGHIAFVVLGKPRSVRSKGGKISFTNKVEEKKEEVAKIYPAPFSGNVEMKIDVFLENVDADDRPDVDRLSTLITDAFEDIAYISDKQIKDLRPRIIDVSQAFNKLECRTEPMGCLELSDMPLGSVFPLAMGIKDYYVVRIIYYN